MSEKKEEVITTLLEVLKNPQLSRSVFDDIKRRIEELIKLEV